MEEKMASPSVAPASLIPTEIGDSENLYEVVNGERREIPHMGALAGIIASVLSQYLGVFATQHKLGLVMVEVLFRLGANGPERRPDVAFISYDRWPLAAVPTEDPPAWPVVPNLAVEVVSP